MVVAKGKLKRQLREWEPKFPFGYEQDGYLIVPVCSFVYGRWRKEYRPLYRLLMDWSIGRRLTADEVVHHIDRDRQNNSLDNLKIVTWEEHRKIHKKLNFPLEKIPLA